MGSHVGVFSEEIIDGIVAHFDEEPKVLTPVNCHCLLNSFMAINVTRTYLFLHVYDIGLPAVLAGVVHVHVPSQGQSTPRAAHARAAANTFC